MEAGASVRRYRMLNDTHRSSTDHHHHVDVGGPNFTRPMHDEQHTGILSIMNSMFAAQRYERKGRETEGFKMAVLQWSSAYAVAYSLMMTIAFGMLITRPIPAEVLAHTRGDDVRLTAAHLRDWRPKSEVLDALVPLLYYFFAAAACCDSAWGMLICAEWGVRGASMPADLYERFVRHLRPDPHDPEKSANTMWAFRFFEPRAVHAGLPTAGVFCTDPSGCGLFSRALHVGFARSPSWDPFYFVDRTVMSLFFAGACLVYLNNGAVPCAIVVGFYLVLRGRVRVQGQAVVSAMFRTLSDAAAQDGVEMSAAEKAVAHASAGGQRASKAWGAALKAAKAQQASSRNLNAHLAAGSGSGLAC